MDLKIGIIVKSERVLPQVLLNMAHEFGWL